MWRDQISKSVINLVKKVVLCQKIVSTGWKVGQLLFSPPRGLPPTVKIVAKTQYSFFHLLPVKPCGGENKGTVFGTLFSPRGGKPWGGEPYGIWVTRWHLSDQMAPEWPSGNWVTRWHLRNQMKPEWPDGTWVTRWHLSDQVATEWPGGTWVTSWLMCDHIAHEWTDLLI